MRREVVRNGVTDRYVSFTQRIFSVSLAELCVLSTEYVRAATFGDYSLDLAAPIGATFLTDNRIEASIGVEVLNFNSGATCHYIQREFDLCRHIP